MITFLWVFPIFNTSKCLSMSINRLNLVFVYGFLFDGIHCSSEIACSSLQQLTGDLNMKRFLHRLNWLNWKYFCFVRPTVTFRYALLLVSLFVTDIFYRKHALLTWNVSCLTCYNVKTLLSSIWWSILFHSAFVHLSNCFVTVQLYILLHIANQIDDPFLPCINLSNRICIVWTVFCRSFIQRKRCFN